MGFLGYALLLAVISAAASARSAEQEADLISWDELPGAPEDLKGKFDMYSGYIDILESEKKIFYWFVESQGFNPEDAPVVLWTNGGPGCSGFLGLLTEHGPFSVRDEGRELETNPYSWNMLANMLYVEQPVGVGFSYSDDIGDYKTGDEVTANDNYNFIQGWLDRFPQYRKNELYLSSESYGGHYIPTLTLNIIKRQKEADEKTINLGGFLVGNPYTDAESNAVAQYQRYWGENLISKPLYDSWMSKCVHGGYRPDLPECGELEELMDDAIGHLNPYALDYPTCTTSSPQGAWLRHHVSGKLSSAAPEYEPCAEDYTVTYLNNPEVLKALHVVDHFSAAGNQWAQCSDKVDYSRADVSSPVMAYYPAIVKASEKKLKILVYSGDDDAICATAGTQWWIWALGFEAQGSIWQPWHVDGQLAGFETRFDELTFITVHRSGHEVPAYTPVSALELFARYLDGRWFDPNPPVPGLDTL